MKKGFTLIELLVVIAIIGILSSVGLSTFTTAQKKSRDAKRKTHLSQLANTLEAYYNDKKQYPADDTFGNLMACGANAAELCAWGSSKMENADTGTVYMVKLPGDPTSGLTYYYDAIPTAGINTKFQLYARLENTKDISVNNKKYQNLNCGSKNCNYGISSSNTTPESGRTLITE